ncbi:tyrosine-type recombinase/integrase [Devosia epidermidihirudinis]|uniref:tyrosine-type recombinase/integrase n=1 Tax=Devosia epidermidihirudinis TaxID=1293439 RepID=UPI001FE05659|nr:tyrosine-type recombinase/integrase [Devosia epidermidihirudinis]
MKLKGLNIRKNRVGKWYVSLRATGVQLGSAPDRRALDALMASPAFLAEYSRASKSGVRLSYATGSLGALIAWYKTKTRYTSLADRTKADYAKAEKFLDGSLDYAVSAIEKADVVELRDQAANEHNDKFSDHVLAFMSAVFSEACERGEMKDNPVLGVRRLYKANAGANRRWSDPEWRAALAAAPAHLRAVLSIAKHCGLRGQDIAVLTWDNYRDDVEMEKVLAFIPRKNGDRVGEITIGVPAALRSLLDAMKAGDGIVQPAGNSPICRNSLGKKYPSENAMRKAWQDFKASESFKSALPNSGDLTLHGLRVTFSSELREQGFTDREVADMLGDLSEGMGKRYSRGAEMRKTSVRVFKRRAE